MELVVRIDPELGVELERALAEHHPDVLVDFDTELSGREHPRGGGRRGARLGRHHRLRPR